MNQESEVIFETGYEDISNKIKPLIDGEYSNKFQELYARVTDLSFRVYSKHQTLMDIMYVLGSNQLRVRTNKELKEKIRKGLESNIMFLKGTSEDVKECYRLGKELFSQMFIEDAEFKDVVTGLQG